MGRDQFGSSRSKDEEKDASTRESETHLESSSLLELGHITLTLERRVGSEEDVFDVIVDVLLPGSEPGDGVLVDDLRTRRRRAGVSIELPLPRR